MNADQRALPLIAMLRVAGIEPLPDGSGLRIEPTRRDDEAYALQTPLLDLTVRKDSVSGTYTARTHGSTTLRVRRPADDAIARLNGKEVQTPDEADYATFELNHRNGDELHFEVRPDR